MTLEEKRERGIHGKKTLKARKNHAFFREFRVLISALSAFSLLFFAICSSADAVEVAAEWKIETEPERIVNGAPFVVRVRPGMQLQSLGGRWLDRRMFFRFDEASGAWIGLAGAGLDRSPGEYELTLEGVTATGARAGHRHMIAVSKVVYPQIALRVARRFTSPDAATLKRIRREQELKSRIFGQVSAERLWDGRFMAPIEGVTTDGFGTQRTFNGEVQGVHQGLDYRATTGTPVAAINAGRVILARDLFYEGNCVVIDHGEGLLTLYLHLSRMRVAEGAQVKRGEVLGLSGATGRVTGPHLHLAVRWQGVYLSPKKLMEIALGGEKKR